MGSASVARSLVHVVTASSLWTLALYLYLVLKSLDIVDVFAGLYFWFNAMRLTRSRFESRKTYKNPTLLQPYIRYLMLCGRDVGLYDAFLVEKLCIAVCLFENFHYGPNGMLIWKKYVTRVIKMYGAESLNILQLHVFSRIMSSFYEFWMLIFVLRTSFG
jgi:hypothetical protein